jgi:hypothetical protein
LFRDENNQKNSLNKKFNDLVLRTIKEKSISSAAAK